MDDRHDWYRPEDQLGPIAGARRCRKCGAKFAYYIPDWPPPERGCPSPPTENGRPINHEELLRRIGEME